MKIVAVCSSISNLNRGGERFCLHLSQELAQRGHSVSLITGNNVKLPLDNFCIPTTQIFEVSNKILRKLFFDYFNPIALAQFKSLLATQKPDIVHFHSTYGISSYLVRFASRRYTTVVTTHDMWACYVDSSIVSSRFLLANNFWKVPFGYLHRKVNRRMYQNAALISPSNWLKDFIVDRGFSKKVIQIPNGVDLPSSRTPSAIRRILWVGALTKNKGLHTVFEPVQKFTDKNGWSFDVLGDGPLLLALKKISGGAQFHGHTESHPFFCRSQILLVTSICFENFPTVVLEGMAHGLCVVGRNIAGIAEIISHEHTGLLFNSTTELLEILDSLKNTPSAALELGENARQVATQRYSFPKCADNYLHRFHALCKAPKF